MFPNTAKSAAMNASANKESSLNNVISGELILLHISE